jgi:hypothetical protein
VGETGAREELETFAAGGALPIRILVIRKIGRKPMTVCHSQTAAPAWNIFEAPTFSHIVVTLKHKL